MRALIKAIVDSVLWQIVSEVQDIREELADLFKISYEKENVCVIFVEEERM